MFFWAGTTRCSEHCEQGHCHGEDGTICPATTYDSSRGLNHANNPESLLLISQYIMLDDNTILLSLGHKLPDAQGILSMCIMAASPPQ